MTCSFSDCDNEFSPNSSRGQKYCSYECSVKANNQRAMQQYYKRKQMLQDPRRTCATVGCPTILRRTNFGDYCDPCTESQSENAKKDFRRMVLGDG